MKSNCISPSKEYLCDSTNSELYNQIETGFSDSCDADLPDDEIIIRDESNCTIEDHCQTINDKDTFVHAYIKRTKFDNFYHDDNGGAIHIINSGITCNNAVFNSCNSTNGGGGGIYIYNDLQISNTINLTNLVFNTCKAVFGGAVFIYASYEDNRVSINDCSFNNNEVYSRSTTSFFGGSAVYITALNSNINRCSFVKNKGNGGAMKINNDIELKPPNNNFYQNNKILSRKQIENIDKSIIINECKFEIDEYSQCSLFFVNGKKHSSTTEVNNCIFTGKLASNSYHIDGQSNSNDEIKLHLHSCKFSSDSKSSLNTKSIRIDMKNQIFNYDNKLENKKLSLKLIAMISTFGIVCIAILVAIISKKKNKQNLEISQETHDISLLNHESI